MRRQTSADELMEIQEEQYECCFGSTHVKPLTIFLATFLLLMTILISGFGFCAESTVVIISTAFCAPCISVLLLLLLGGVAFENAMMMIPFIVVFGVYLIVTCIIVFGYIILGTATNLIFYMHESNMLLQHFYHAYQLDSHSDRIRTLTCVGLLVIGIVHLIVCTFTWSVFFLTFLYIRNRKSIKSRRLLLPEQSEEPATNPLNSHSRHSLLLQTSNPSSLSS
ncbi:hypothetical protein M3Y94_00815500 [Aphelenchoides besseyi]|nr:hypothetical protein M3Y94_00815500 [Aphelenchoides besseyi]KAI6227167.1 hypothetical protein M3Y95_00698000 [Aphelenchoides besseyi]